MTAERAGPEPLPDGTQGVFTLLFTDIENSTHLWEAHPEHMERAILAHNKILADVVARTRGTIVRFMGDGMFALFRDATDAVAAAVDLQRTFAGRRWPGVGELRVRAGLNTGPCRIHDGEVFGRAPNLAARLESAGHGGQILMSAATADACAGRLRPDEQLFDLGRYHIRGFATTVVVHSVLADGLQSNFGPLRTPYRGFDELPSTGPPIHGRRPLIEAIEERFHDRRLTTLKGPAGVGKTRIALDVAVRARRPYRDGVRFVDLSIVDPDRGDQEPPSDVVGFIAAALRAQPASGEAPGDTVVRVLRSSQLLLVLDNCEPVLRALRPVVARIIEECPGVHMLATSREVLRLSGEVALDVTPLPVPPPGERDRQRLAAYDVVKVFLDKAQETDPGFVLTEANAAAVGALCRALDGLPLAVQLAASRLDVETVEDLSADTSSLIARLASDEVDDDARRSIWGPLRWATSRLEPHDTQLLSGLATFTGSFPRSVAARVSGRGAAGGHTLDRLVRTSLVVRDTMWPGRFRLLGSVREFARTLNSTGEWEQHRRAHATCMLSLADHHSARLRTEEEAEAVRELQGDFADSRLAIEYLLDRQDLEGASRGVVALFQFAMLAPRPEIHTLATRIAEQLNDEDAHAAEVVGAAAIGAWFAGDTERAIQLGTRAVRIAADHGGSTTWARTALVDALAYAGRLEDAAEHFSALVKENQEDPDPYWHVHGLAFEAISLTMAGRQRAAEQRALAALAVARGIDNASCVQWALYALGRVYAPKEPLAACAAFEQAMEVAREVEMRFAIGLSLVEWVEAKRRLGDRAAAASGAVDLLEMLATSGNRSQLSQVLREAGGILGDAGHLEAAAIVLLARRGLPHMPKSELENPQEASELDSLRAELTSSWPHLEIRARAIREPELIDLCRRELTELVQPG